MTELKPLTPQDAAFLPIEYDLTEQRLAELAKEYDPTLIPEASEKGDEGYLIVHAKVMDIVKVRTNVEKKRVTLKSDALAWGKKVDGEAKRLTKIVEDLEAPWRQVKTDLDEAQAIEEARALIAETQRLAKIEQRIIDIRLLGDGLINADAVTIQKRIDTLDNMVVSVALFAEFQEAAKLTGDITRKSLQMALDERATFEANEAKLAESRKAFEAEKAQMAEDRKKFEAEQAAVRASTDAAKAAEEKEAQRQADEIREREEASVKQGAAIKNKAYLKERLPEDKLVREYADRLAEVARSVPALGDEALCDLVTGKQNILMQVIDGLKANTQGKK
jgi:hypothetical protein